MPTGGDSPHSTAQSRFVLVEMRNLTELVGSGGDDFAGSRKLLDDGCVLQAGVDMHIWGTGDPGRIVLTRLADERHMVQVNDGTWNAPVWVRSKLEGRTS